MIIEKIADELKVLPAQIQAAVSLLDEGATVPFIARYRKEATQGLDDAQLRDMEQRLAYLRELEDRRTLILKSIQDQDKLTPELAKQIAQVQTKAELEDLYLPFKPKRTTKGELAKQAGLAPLAELLLTDSSQQPEHAAEAYINQERGIADVKSALEGARYILMERFAEDASLLAKIRKYLLDNAHIQSKVIEGKQKEGAKYADYFDHSEKLKNAPSHRALALFRGRNEGVLQVSMNADPQNEESDRHSYCEHIIAKHIDFRANHANSQWLQSVMQWSWRVKIMLHMETELFRMLREQAEEAAIEVFANNLKDLLMAAPAGAKVTMGLDPGLRTGVKVAIVDNTGKILQTATIYPHAPQNHWDKSIRTLTLLCQTHKVELISIGNGTASRETDKLVSEMLKLKPELKIAKLVISEAGASVYSASALASAELPDMDVSLRGAVSIARRLQDPLAELVKIEPKAIGVGQYQHDVSQSQLGLSLDRVIEDCVNAVGVDVNTASVALLSHVSGLNKTLAQNIISHRDQHGAFSDRKQLKDVPRLGPKAFEQSAGFLRINGNNPLDASAVHPESYAVVDKIISQSQFKLAELIGNSQLLSGIQATDFVDDSVGLPTIIDILSELEKPGRDPRPEFKTAKFKEGVESINDLTPGMILEGTVSNVANFGAFVDIGVHQDGLVHISAMTNKFISDPREVVKAGEIVKVKVLEVDVPRKRISLTMRLQDNAPAPSKQKPSATNSKKGIPTGNRHDGHRNKSRNTSDPSNSAMGNAFADAFAKAKKPH